MNQRRFMNSSKKYFALQVGDLLEQINKLDVLIAMHKEAGTKLKCSNMSR